METNLSAEERKRDGANLPRTVYLALWFPLLSETFVYYEVEGLRRRGFPVSVVTLYGCRFKNISKAMLESPVEVRRLGCPAFFRIMAAVFRRWFRQPGLTWRILRRAFTAHWRDAEMRLENYWACVAGFYLAEKLKEADVEHVHGAWASGPATAAWVVQQLEGIPFSFTARATDVRPPDGFLAEKLADCSFARADSYFNVPHMASFLPEDQRGKVCLAYNSLTLPKAEPAPVLMASPIRVIAIGRLIEKKGFVYLLRALALLREQGRKVTATIVGDGSQNKPLRKETERLHLEKEVRFTGALPHDRIAGLLAESDMLVMPSIVSEGTQQSDGLPTVIMEAMNMGVPVVSTNVASIPDVVHDRETGRLLPQKDAAALAQAMAELMDSREEALRMAGNARMLVREMFSEENTLGKMEALFQAHRKQA